MIKHPEIFKIDTKGKTRVWSMHREGACYRTVAGIHGGNLVESGWTTVTGKQGRTDMEQALFEVEAAYTKKLKGEYHMTIEDTSKGAHFYKPMLAHSYKDYPGRCYAQPKLDGVRCIATVDGMFSRTGEKIHGAPHLHRALKPLFEADPECVLDGELYNHEFRDDFGEITSIVRKQNPTPEQLGRSMELMEYHVYDMPSHPGNFSDRIYSVTRAIDLIDDLGITSVPTVHVGSSELLDQLYEEWISDGWEGQMVRLDLPYEQKRSKTLLKRKEFIDEEFEVVSIEEGNGNWAGVAKRVTCRLLDGRTFGAGIKGTRERAAELLHETHKVVTVKYFCLSPDGVPRFPIATKFHGAERTL